LCPSELTPALSYEEREYAHKGLFYVIGRSG
jgi:hypothetical protein